MTMKVAIAIPLMRLYKRSGGFWNIQKIKKKPPDETSPICCTTARYEAKKPAPTAAMYMNGSTIQAASRRVAQRKVIELMPITSSASTSSEMRIAPISATSPVNTLPPKISPTSRAANLAMSPSEATQSRGIANHVLPTELRSGSQFPVVSSQRVRPAAMAARDWELGTGNWELHLMTEISGCVAKSVCVKT